MCVRQEGRVRMLYRQIKTVRCVSWCHISATVVPCFTSAVLGKHSFRVNSCGLSYSTFLFANSHMSRTYLWFSHVFCLLLTLRALAVLRLYRRAAHSLSQQPCLHALCFTIPAAAPLCSHSLWSFHCVFSISVCLSYSSSMEGCPHTPSWDCRGCRAQWLDEDLPPHVRLNSVLLLPLGRALVPQHPLPRATAARTPSPWRHVLSLITHWAFLLYNK